MNLFEFEADEFSRLEAGELVQVVNHLLRAEAGRSDIPPQALHLNLKVNEPDRGVDARILAHRSNRSLWIPPDPSVWQVKAGSLDPADMRNEFAKPGVQEMVQQGGWYCIANGNDYGDGRRGNRQETLKELFDDLGLDPKYHFYTSSDLAAWASELPAIALLGYFSRPIGELMLWESWASDPAHTIPFKTDPTRASIIQEIRRVEQERTPTPLHIAGLAGTGKTRLALEAFRDTMASERLMYAMDPNDMGVFHLS